LSGGVLSMKVRDAFAEMDRVSLDAPMSSADVGPDVLTRDALLAQEPSCVLGCVRHGRFATRRERHRQLNRLAETGGAADNASARILSALTARAIRSGFVTLSDGPRQTMRSMPA
jgi:hypothetical protein